MKNCFKTVLAAVAVLVWLGASAQDDPSKETVIINPFTHTSAVSQAACDNIRAAVLSGFADRGRFHIVDALTDGTLSKLYADRNVEDVVNDANWKSESEAAYKALGARKVVIGQANNVSFSQFKSDIDGKMYNKAEVTYSLKVYNIADGAMIGSEDLSVSGIDADSKDGAFNDAMKDLRKGHGRVRGQAFQVRDLYPRAGRGRQERPCQGALYLGRYGDGRCQKDPFQRCSWSVRSARR